MEETHVDLPDFLQADFDASTRTMAQLRSVLSGVLMMAAAMAMEDGEDGGGGSRTSHSSSLASLSSLRRKAELVALFDQEITAKRRMRVAQWRRSHAKGGKGSKGMMEAVVGKGVGKLVGKGVGKGVEAAVGAAVEAAVEAEPCASAASKKVLLKSSLLRNPNSRRSLSSFVASFPEDEEEEEKEEDAEMDAFQPPPPPPPTTSSSKTPAKKHRLPATPFISTSTASNLLLLQANNKKDISTSPSVSKYQTATTTTTTTTETETTTSPENHVPKHQQDTQSATISTTRTPKLTTATSNSTLASTPTLSSFNYSSSINTPLKSFPLALNPKTPLVKRPKKYMDNQGGVGGGGGERGGESFSSISGNTIHHHYNNNRRKSSSSYSPLLRLFFTLLLPLSSLALSVYWINEFSNSIVFCGEDEDSVLNNDNLNSNVHGDDSTTTTTTALPFIFNPLFRVWPRCYPCPVNSVCESRRVVACVDPQSMMFQPHPIAKLVPHILRHATSSSTSYSQQQQQQQQDTLSSSSSSSSFITTSNLVPFPWNQPVCVDDVDRFRRAEEREERRRAWMKNLSLGIQEVVVGWVGRMECGEEEEKVEGGGGEGVMMANSGLGGDQQQLQQPHHHGMDGRYGNQPEHQQGKQSSSTWWKWLASKTITGLSSIIDKVSPFSSPSISSASSSHTSYPYVWNGTRVVGMPIRLCKAAVLNSFTKGTSLSSSDSSSSLLDASLVHDFEEIWNQLMASLSYGGGGGGGGGEDDNLNPHQSLHHQQSQPLIRMVMDPSGKYRLLASVSKPPRHSMACSLRIMALSTLTRYAPYLLLAGILLISLTLLSTRHTNHARFRRIVAMLVEDMLDMVFEESENWRVDPVRHPVPGLSVAQLRDFFLPVTETGGRATAAEMERRRAFNKMQQQLQQHGSGGGLTRTPLELKSSTSNNNNNNNNNSNIDSSSSSSAQPPLVTFYEEYGLTDRHGRTRWYFDKDARLRSRVWRDAARRVLGNSNIRETAMEMNGEMHAVWQWVGSHALSPGGGGGQKVGGGGTPLMKMI